MLKRADQLLVHILECWAPVTQMRRKGTDAGKSLKHDSDLRSPNPETVDMQDSVTNACTDDDFERIDDVVFSMGH